MGSAVSASSEVTKGRGTNRAADLRPVLVWALPAAFTAGWLVFVVIRGHLDRVVEHWGAALTMVFGSFVAGSTPQGGGAVAFPVFTKVLEVTPEVARSFSLLIQASGMVMASATILLAGRTIDRRAMFLGVSGGAVGLFGGLYLLGRPAAPFWPSRLDPAYVKVTFTVFIFAVALIVARCAANPGKLQQVPHWSRRSVAVMLLFGVTGGVLTSLTGSGVDVLLFVFVVLVARVSPKVAIPTSIVSMAAISVLGAVVVVIGGGQLDIVTDGIIGGQVTDPGAGGAAITASAQIVAVNGQTFGPADATRFDIFGLWLAAAPIVVWGAPLGSYVADRVSEQTVIRFVAAMALLEVTTTVLFLDRLHTDVTLVAFAVGGLILAWVVVQRLERFSFWIMAVDPDQPSQQSHVKSDLAPDPM